MSNTRPDFSLCLMESARKQKKAILKELRNINRIFEKLVEKENRVVFEKQLIKGVYVSLL